MFWSVHTVGGVPITTTRRRLVAHPRSQPGRSGLEFRDTRMLAFKAAVRTVRALLKAGGSGNDLQQNLSKIHIGTKTIYRRANQRGRKYCTCRNISKEQHSSAIMSHRTIADWQSLEEEYPWNEDERARARVDYSVIAGPRHKIYCGKEISK